MCIKNEKDFFFQKNEQVKQDDNEFLKFYIKNTRAAKLPPYSEEELMANRLFRPTKRLDLAEKEIVRE